MTPVDPQPASSTGNPLARLAAAVMDLIIGLVLIGLGVVGLVLPVLPGWLLIGAGALVLAGRVPALRTAIDWMIARPWVQDSLRRIAARRQGRRPLVRMLKMPVIRRALFPRTRRQLVNDLTQSGAANAGPDPGADRAE